MEHNRFVGEPAITAEEWDRAVVHRENLMLLLGRDGALTLIQTGEDGQTQTVRIPEAHLLTLAAAAVGLSEFMSTREADLQVLSAMILERYAAGARQDTLPPPVRQEIEELLIRQTELARKIDVLARRSEPDRQGQE